MRTEKMADGLELHFMSELVFQTFEWQNTVTLSENRFRGGVSIDSLLEIGRQQDKMKTHHLRHLQVCLQFPSYIACNVEIKESQAY